MTQALAELRGPVGHEALRLRMSALHGREDPLLDPTRFPRLLRQANDAEIADVRKVGEDDYEITARRGALLPPPPSAPPSAPPAAVPEAEPEAAPAVPGEPDLIGSDAGGAGRDGLRFGVRFRRGSRGGLRTGEIPLVGVVQVDEPVEASTAAVSPPVDGASAPEEAPAKSSRPRRAPRKKAATGGRAAKPARTDKAPKAEAPAGEGESAAAPAKRPRARTPRKKAE
jgi:hypothetical protein